MVVKVACRVGGFRVVIRVRITVEESVHERYQLEKWSEW